MSTSNKLLVCLSVLLVGIKAFYVQQCQVLPKWVVNGTEIEISKGHISVMAFLDASSSLCIDQATKLSELRGRLNNAGFSNITFLIINTRNATDKYERLTNASGEIPVYQETTEDQTYETLGVAKDHILIVDKCNRLTYQVIMPWSLLHYPYVKAAILSSYKNDPCGACPEGEQPPIEQKPTLLTEAERNRTMEELLQNSNLTEIVQVDEKKQSESENVTEVTEVTTTEAQTANKTEGEQERTEKKLKNYNKICLEDIGKRTESKFRRMLMSPFFNYGFMMTGDFMELFFNYTHGDLICHEDPVGLKNFLTTIY